MAEEKRRGDGPKTPEGKAKSRENATKHGARAQHVHLAADETAEQYDEHCRNWRESLNPQSFLEEQLVEQLILNSWLMLRANRRNSAVDGQESDPHQIELMQRYKTTAERAFSRSWAAVRQLKNDLLKLHVQVEQLLKQSAENREKLDKFEKKERKEQEEEQQASQNKADAATAGQTQQKADKTRIVEQRVEIRTAAPGARHEDGYLVSECLGRIVNLRRLNTAQEERLPPGSGQQALGCSVQAGVKRSENGIACRPALRIRLEG